MGAGDWVTAPCWEVVGGHTGLSVSSWGELGSASGGGWSVAGENEAEQWYPQSNLYGRDCQYQCQKT